MKRTPLKRVSSKQRKRLAEYSKLRKEYFKEHPMCECEGCNKRAEDIHHMAGRGRNTNKVETWMAVCRKCHDRIHANPSWARKVGYLV